MDDRKDDLLKKDQKEEKVAEAEEENVKEEEKVEDAEPQDEVESPDVEEEPRKFFHSSGSSQIYAGPKRSSKKIPFLLGILVIILILGGLFYLLRARPKTLEQPSPSPGTFVEEPSPEFSPAPFERSKHTLRVLNGTKTQGLAASTSAKLKELGYQIEKTGNATNSAFLKTVVRVKPDLKELLESLLKDLGALDFEGEEGPELKDSDSSDGEVILGAE